MKIEGYDNLGRYYNATNSAAQSNYGKIFWQDVFALGDTGAAPLEDPTNLISIGLNFINTSSVPYSGSAWRDSFYHNYIFGSVLWVVAHGGAYLHTDGEDAGTIEGPYYLAARIAHNGSGLPPFNSTSKPPPNLIVFDSCCVFSSEGSMTSFSGSLHPSRNVYSGFLIENQSAWGYTIKIATNQSQERAALILGSLIGGETILGTKMQFLMDAEEIGILATESSIPPINWRTLNEIEDIQILGDSHTQLRNVYDASGINNPSWHRPL